MIKNYRFHISIVIKFQKTDNIISVEHFHEKHYITKLQNKLMSKDGYIKRIKWDIVGEEKQCRQQNSVEC